MSVGFVMVGHVDGFVDLATEFSLGPSWLAWGDYMENQLGLVEDC